MPTVAILACCVASAVFGMGVVCAGGGGRGAVEELGPIRMGLGQGNADEVAELRHFLARCWIGRRECRATVQSSTIEGALVESTYHTIARAATRSAMILTVRREGHEWALPGEPIYRSEQSYECDDMTLRDGSELSGRNLERSRSGLRYRERDTGQWYDL